MELEYGQVCSCALANSCPAAAKIAEDSRRIERLWIGGFVRLEIREMAGMLAEI